MKYLLVFSLLFFVHNSFAGVTDSAKNVWDKTKDATNSAINTSIETGGKVIESSKQAYASFSESSSPQELAEERFSEIWGEALELLEDGLGVMQETKSAPDSAFFKKDKKSLRTDFNEILDDIISLLNDPNIQDHRDDINSLRNQINETKKDITEYREKRVVAPRENMVKTTKSGYDQKIKEAELDILEFESEIEKIHLQLLEWFKYIGLELDLNQITVLLARVDSNNIIQMSAVFDVLKMITERFVELTQTSGEDIATARRYYGMQVILIETVIFMQDKYIEKMNNDYLPKLKVIILDTVALKRSTQQSISKTSAQNRKKVYQKNLEAQELTLKVANLYLNQLIDQRGKVINAKNKMVGNLELAKNTYDTVEISAELMNLMNSNKESFDVIMSLQVPEIVPFENLEMKEEFQRLSMKMQGME
ncbi:MAG: hypothetical protein ACI8PB_000036 [Desulforhopalus sp.]|jgi:hypothetical protein